MVSNMKGGVGKTTLAVEMSRTLAYAYDKDVLLIDYDPQANASFAFFEPGRYFRLLNDGKGVANCLMPARDASDPFSVIRAVESDNVNLQELSVRVRGWYYRHDRNKKAGKLDLVPGSLELMRLALNQLPDDTEKSLLRRWNSLINNAKQTYDCVIVDCHPAGFFSQSQPYWPQMQQWSRLPLMPTRQQV